MGGKDNRAASHIIRVIIIAVLSVFAMLSLSGCLGFDIHISTPLDKLEQRVEESERYDEDGMREHEDDDNDDDNNIDSGVIIDEDGFMWDKDGNLLRNPPQTNRDLAGGISEFVNHL